MKDLPWIKFYSADWLTGTAGLSAAEKGVFITLLMLMYDAGGAIARDDARLARKCGLPLMPFRRALSGLIDDGKVIEEAGNLSNQRVRDEIASAAKHSEAKAKNASSRWQKDRGLEPVATTPKPIVATKKNSSLEEEKAEEKQRPENATAMRLHTESESESEAESHIPSEDKSSSGISLSRSRAEARDGELFPSDQVQPRKKAKKPPAAKVADDEQFAAFWAQYPRRESKPDARKAFDAALASGADAAEITLGAMRYAAEREREPDPVARHKFTKLPATWLRRECWKDAPPPQPIHHAIGGEQPGRLAAAPRRERPLSPIEAVLLKQRMNRRPE